MSETSATIQLIQAIHIAWFCRLPPSACDQWDFHPCFAGLWATGNGVPAFLAVFLHMAMDILYGKWSIRNHNYHNFQPDWCLEIFLLENSDFDCCPVQKSGMDTTPAFHQKRPRRFIGIDPGFAIVRALPWWKLLTAIKIIEMAKIYNLPIISWYFMIFHDISH